MADRTYVVTGAASGIGAATAELIRSHGHRVIGVDRRAADGVDVEADLSTPAGRAAAVTAVRERADVVHGLVPAAGLGPATGGDPALMVAVNYFGAVDVVTGLRHELCRGGADGGAGVVLLASNSITCMPGWDGDVAAACLAGDEPEARELASRADTVLVYPVTKAALAWWARREGVTPAWAGAGVRLNAVAPGLVETAMTEQLRRDPQLGPFADSYPTALDRPGRPEEVAAGIWFLLDGGGLAVGTVLYLDGGTDAILHPRAPQGVAVPPRVTPATGSTQRTRRRR